MALLIIWFGQAAVGLSNTDRTIITRESQGDFGTKLTVQMFKNESTGRYVFTISVPANDPVLTHVYNCFLVIGTKSNPKPCELLASLRLSTHTDGT